MRLFSERMAVYTSGMNPQDNPYAHQVLPGSPIPGSFPEPRMGGRSPYQAYSAGGVPSSYDQSLQQGRGGLPPVATAMQNTPYQMPRTSQSAPMAAPATISSQRGASMHQSMSSGATQTPAQAAISATKQAVAQYANNPYEMVRAVQGVRSAYLAQQYNITDKNAE